MSPSSFAGNPFFLDLEELTREVREHNHFARRVPVVEEQIRGMDRRLEQLEQGQRRQPIS